ncbi:alcohol dehydrogenase [Cadophora sp. DSE1049]|nr:alcohol dehydrogenase [Cadophora sp. DSE1049]
MRGVVWEGKPYEMAVTNLPMPTILNATDAIVRITTSALCGSDLHTYRGFMGTTNPPWTMGHEAVGYVSDLGSEVTTLALGDYVIVPDSIYAPSYHEERPLVGFFGGGTPGLDGLQAEYARVPFAATNLIPIPVTQNTTNATIEADYLAIADIYPTAWTAVSFSGLQAGDTVAIFGAGPLGLLAASSAMIRGASRVYVVDQVPMRLGRAAALGAIPINFLGSDPVDQIMAFEPAGVTRAIDCVGMDSVNAEGQFQTGLVLTNMIRVAAYQGGLGQIGVYMSGGANTTAAPNGALIPSHIDFPVTEFFTKGLYWGAGIVNPFSVLEELMALIGSGRVKPSFIGSAYIGIEEAPEYYARFNSHDEVKVYIRFP